MLAVAKNFHLPSQNLYTNPMPTHQRYVPILIVLQREKSHRCYFLLCYVVARGFLLTLHGFHDRFSPDTKGYVEQKAYDEYLYDTLI